MRETRASVEKIRAAARRGETWALVQLGHLHRSGARDRRGRVLVKADLREAERCMRRAVELGDRNALVGLADVWSGDGAARGLRRAVPLYRAAHRGGDAMAAFNLACTYQNVGRHRDAVRWFRRAAAAGDPSAAIELARAELYGLGTRRNPRAAMARLRAVADGMTSTWPADRIEAMLVMADALMTGWLVRRDHDKGVAWLRRATALGSGVARAMLRWHGAPRAKQ